MEKTRARDKQPQLHISYALCLLSSLPSLPLRLGQTPMGVFCDLMVLVKDDETDNNNTSSG